MAIVGLACVAFEFEGARWLVPLIGAVSAAALGARLPRATLAMAVAVTLLAALGVGATLGLGYYSSITYSLRTDTGRGRNTGLHEASLGGANFLLPLIGGALARASGRIQDPYVVAGILVVVGVAVQAGFLLRWRRRWNRP